MNEVKAKGVLLQMGLGDRCDEYWFTSKGLTVTDLAELVEEGYLLLEKRDPNNKMSDNHYILTQEGKDFAWQ